jgi:hypothetical protein
MLSHLERSERSPLLIEEVDYPPRTPPEDEFKTLGGKLERGSPFSKKCHSEPNLRGVSSVPAVTPNAVRGLLFSPLELHQIEHKGRFLLLSKKTHKN